MSFPLVLNDNGLTLSLGQVCLNIFSDATRELINFTPAELSAASVLIDYWIKPAKVNNAVWIVVCLIVTVTINMFGAGQL